MKSARFVFPVSLMAVLLLGHGSASATTARSPGSWSLQFHITNNFTLDSFDGASIALKRHFSAQTALRASIYLNTQGLNVDTSADSNSALSDAKDDRNATTANLTVLLLRYRTPERTATFVWGVGPQLGYGRDRRTVRNEFTSGALDHATTTRTMWSTGLRGIAGVECSVVDWLAVQAEYRMNAVHVWDDTDISATQGNTTFTSTEKRRAWSVQGSSVTFGVSVYF